MISDEENEFLNEYRKECDKAEKINQQFYRVFYNSGTIENRTVCSYYGIGEIYWSPKSGSLISEFKNLDIYFNSVEKRDEFFGTYRYGAPIIKDGKFGLHVSVEDFQSLISDVDQFIIDSKKE